MNANTPFSIALLIIPSIFIFIRMIASIFDKIQYHKDIERLNFKLNSKKITLYCFLFFIYVSTLSFLGLFKNNSIPPRLFLFTTIPLIIFYFYLVFKNKVLPLFLNAVSLEDLIKLHTIRWMGSFFLVLCYFEDLPNRFGIPSGLGDIAAAISAYYVSKIVKRKSDHYLKIAFIWNTFALIDIVFVFVNANVTNVLAIQSQSPGLEKMAFFPYCFIPAFAPATFIFLHLCIFQKIKKLQFNKTDMKEG